MAVLEERSEGNKKRNFTSVAIPNLKAILPVVRSRSRYMDRGKKKKKKSSTVTRALWADFSQSIQAALSSEEQFHQRDLFGN